MMFTKVLVSMFTKASVFIYYNVTIKQSANKGLNYNYIHSKQCVYLLSYSVCIMSHLKLSEMNSMMQKRHSFRFGATQASINADTTLLSYIPILCVYKIL